MWPGSQRRWQRQVMRAVPFEQGVETLQSGGQPLAVEPDVGRQGPARHAQTQTLLARQRLVQIESKPVAAGGRGVKRRCAVGQGHPLLAGVLGVERPLRVAQHHAVRSPDLGVGPVRIGKHEQDRSQQSHPGQHDKQPGPASERLHRRRRPIETQSYGVAGRARRRNSTVRSLRHRPPACARRCAS